MISTIIPYESKIESGERLPRLPILRTLSPQLAQLKDSGFNNTDLEIISTKIPDLKLKVLVFSEDHSVADIVKDALELAATFKLPVVFKLNSKLIIVAEDTVPSKLLQQCQNLRILQTLDSIQLDSENQSGKSLFESRKKVYLALPVFLQDWIDERFLADDLGPKHEVVRVALDALRLYSNFTNTSELIAYWNRVHEGKLNENDPKLKSSCILLAAKVAMIELESSQQGN